MQQHNWDDLRFLLAIGRSGTVVDAGRKLGVNQTTVVRRLDQCEQRFGTRLFDRVRGAMRPTETGATLIAHAERVEREVLAAQARVSGQDQKAEGTVRITSVPIMINHVLVPALPALLARHPNLQLELVADPRELSLTKREADFAIRLARPNREAQILAQKIGELTYGAYGPAEHEAKEAAWILYDDTMAHLPHARWLAAQSADEDRSVTVNDAETIAACLKAGVGRSLLPTAIAKRIGGLANLELTPAPPTREVWLLSHPEHKTLVRMNVVADWLRVAVRQAVG